MIWNGVPLGFDRDGRPISYDGNAPTLIFGPPGSNKTVGFVANQLLSDDGRRSFVVIDPKGEICAITSKFRRSLRGHDVKIINPYGELVNERPDLKSDGWNPLGDLDPASPAFGDDCQAKGESAIKTGSNEAQPHFPDSARSGVTAAIMWEVREASAQNLPPSFANVRAILTQEPKKLRVAIERMVACGDFDISSRAAKFLADNTEIQNIKSTIETQTAWMTKPMRDDMCVAGGVDFRACAARPTTAYIIVPTSELMAKATYLRLALSSALRALYRHGGVPTTLIVEEGYVIGHHAEIEQACSILRGYGSRVVAVFQSLQQIKKLYPDTWGLFTAGAVLGFRPADLETAEWMTKKAGEVVVPVLSAADPSSPADLGARPSWQQQKRQRIPVAKMFGMPQGRALVWRPGDEAPRVARVKGYFEIPRLNARASPNPYYTGRGSTGGVPRGGASRGVAAAIAVAALAAGAWLLWPSGAAPAVTNLGQPALTAPGHASPQHAVAPRRVPPLAIR